MPLDAGGNPSKIGQTKNDAPLGGHHLGQATGGTTSGGKAGSRVSPRSRRQWSQTRHHFDRGDARNIASDEEASRAPEAPDGKNVPRRRPSHPRTPHRPRTLYNSRSPVPRITKRLAPGTTSRVAALTSSSAVPTSQGARSALSRKLLPRYNLPP